MSDRRRTQRYVLGTPLTGDIMPMHDVVIEKLDGERVTVLSPSAHDDSEDLMIHVSTSSGLRESPHTSHLEHAHLERWRAAVPHRIAHPRRRTRRGGRVVTPLSSRVTRPKTGCFSDAQRR